MQLVTELDPEGAKQRRCKRLKRRVYCCKVRINYTHHIYTKTVFIVVSTHTVLSVVIYEL